MIGRSFAQVAEHFGIDPGHEIAGLLERRDTWSGRTVLWPIEGTDLAAPVDLAALPVYARNRSFEGFRGFGIGRGARGQEEETREGEEHQSEEARDPGAPQARAGRLMHGVIET